METYSFEINKRSLFIKIVLAALLFTLVLTALTMLYAHKLVGPVFFLGIFAIISPIIFMRKLVSREEVTIKDDGFYIKSQGRFIEWKELSWYKAGRNNSRSMDLLEFGVANGKKVSFPFYKQSKDGNNNWTVFKKEIIHDVGVNHPGLRNYYDKKVFQLYARYIYILWILAPVILVLVGANVSDNFATTAMLIVGTAPLLSAIKKNRNLKLN